MIIVQGDLVKAFQRGEVDIMAHQVNCQGVMASGIAQQVRAACPEHFKDYTSALGEGKHLGGTFVTNAGEARWIFGIFGQDTYGKEGVHTNHAALCKGLMVVARSLQFMDQSEREVKIGIPYLIGCGLGGGEWSLINTLIIDIEAMYDMQFYVYHRV